MRVCCGLTGHLELAKRRDLYGGPVVVGAGGRGESPIEKSDHVIAASEEAMQFGVMPGMPLRQAEHLCPHATFIVSDPDAAARLRELIASALYDLAPVVEVHVEGIAWLDVNGVVRSGESIREARRRLRTAIGREPRLGLAPGPFSARVAAARARPGRLVQVEDARSFLAPGRAGRHAVLLARGAEPDELTPWRPPQFTSAHRQFEPPVEDREALLFVSRALCGDLAAELGLRGAGAKRVRVRLVYESGEPDARESLVRHPLSSAAELFGLIGPWIKEWQPRAPITELWIDLPVLEAAGRRQLRLWAGGDGTSEEVIAAFERLQERHGDSVVRKPRPALLTSPLPAQRFA